MLNTITAEAFRDACDRLEGAENFAEAVHDLIKEYALEHERIIFNGNAYSPEWEKEAKRRGLSNLVSMVDAIPALTDPVSVRMFEEFRVFTKAELSSRAEVKYESYAKAMHIEAKTMLSMAEGQFIPAMIRYAGQLGKDVQAVEACGLRAPVQRELLGQLQEKIERTFAAKEALTAAVLAAEGLPEGEERARAYRECVVPAMEGLRKPVDAAERIVDRGEWPVPTYADLLFEV